MLVDKQKYGHKNMISVYKMHHFMWMCGKGSSKMKTTIYNYVEAYCFLAVFRGQMSC